MDLVTELYNRNGEEFHALVSALSLEDKEGMIGVCNNSAVVVAAVKVEVEVVEVEAVEAVKTNNLQALVRVCQNPRGKRRCRRVRYCFPYNRGCPGNQRNSWRASSDLWPAHKRGSFSRRRAKCIFW